MHLRRQYACCSENAAPSSYDGRRLAVGLPLRKTLPWRQDRRKARVGRPPPHDREQDAAGAFTLVELLVVVAILALLLAILLPALGRGRDLTNFATCKSRLHRVGLGVTAYAQDYRGKLAQTATLENPLPEVVEAYYRARPYVQYPQEFYCPSVTKPGEIYTPENFDAGRIAYFYYCARQAPPDPYISTFLRHIVTWPRNLAVWSDPESWVFSDIWLAGEPTAHAGYKKGVNYLRLNGEVSAATESPRESFR